MSNYIHRSPTLLKNKVAKQRFIFASVRFHIHKKHFVINRSESFHFYLNRPTHRTFDNLLRSSLQLDHFFRTEYSELFFPSRRQSQITRPRVDKGIDFL